MVEVRIAILETLMILSDRYFQRFLVPMVHPMPFGGLDMQPWLKGGAVGESGEMYLADTSIVV
jgi:hypothetical protein